MTGAAKILRHFVTAEPAGIKNQFGIGLSCLAGQNMLSTRTVTGLTADARRDLLQIYSSATDGPLDDN